MALTREERKLLHQKAKQPTFGAGKPDKSEGYDGDISFRKVEGSGTVEYVKQNGDWIAVASSGEMPTVRIVGGSGGGGGTGITVHGSLSGLGSDDHKQYILVDGTRAFTGAVTVGSDGAGHDVTFHSGTGSDLFFWDASEEVLQITGTNAATALDILDGDVRVVDTLYFYDRGGESISSNGSTLSIAGGSEIDLTATAIDVNGTFDASGTVGLASSSGVTTIGSSNALTVSAAGVLTVNSATDATSSTSGSTIIDGGVGIAKKLYVGTDLDVDGTTNLDAVDIDGNVQLDGTFTIGTSGNGHEVTMHGSTSGNYIQYDDGNDELILTQDTKIMFHDSGDEYIGATSDGNLKINAGTNLLLNSAGTLDINGATGVDIQENGSNIIRISTTRVISTANTAQIDLDCSGSLSLNSSGGPINVGNDTDTGNINIGSGSSARTITVGHSASTEVEVHAILVDINAGSNGITIDAAGASNLTTSSGALTITSAAAATWSTAAGNLTLDSAAGNLVLDGHTGVNIDASNSGKVAIDGAGGIDIGVAADVAIDIDSSTLDIDASGAVTIDSTSTILISGDDGATFSDDTKAIVYDGSGNLDFDAVALDMDLTDSSSITITSSEAAEDLTIQQVGGNDSSIFILAAGTGSDAIKIDATAGSMEIGVSLADEKTITLGNTGSTYLQLIPHGTAGSEKILIKNTAGSADDALKLWSAAGGITLLAASDSLNIDADGTASDALNIDSAGGIDIDAADEITINTTSADGHIILASAHTSGLAFHIDANQDAASEVQIDAGILDVDVTAGFSIDGAAASNITVGSGDTDENLTLSVTGATASSLILSSAGTGSDAIDINSTAGGVDIDAANEIEITTTSADGHISLVSAHTAGLAFHIDANSHASSEVQIDAGILDVDVTGSATIDAGAASNLTTSAGALTITSAAAATWSSAAGNLTVDSAAGVLVLDGHTGITLDASNSGNIEINVTAADDILIGNDAVAQDVLIGNAAATQVDLTAILVDINGGSSGVTIDGGAASNFTTSAGALTLASAATATWTCGGNLTLDVTGNIILDAASNIIYFKDNGTHALTFENDENGEWTIENQTAGQQIDISSPNGITLDGYSLSCNQNYELHIGSSGVNNFYTHGDADLKKNYSMIAVQFQTPATGTGSDIWSEGASYYNS